MSDLDAYILCKLQRELPGGTPTLASVLATFRLADRLGKVRAIDIASPQNSIEIVRTPDEIGLLFDHNYFFYFKDLLACYFSRDDEGMQRHLTYIINRFLLEASLQHESYELTAGLLHLLLVCDVDGANPLGMPPFGDAGTLSAKLAQVHDLQFRFTVAHEIGHAAMAMNLDVVRLARGRLEYVNRGMERAWSAAGGQPQGDHLSPHDIARRLAATAGELAASNPPDLILAEFLCDNIAADALGEALDRGGASAGLVGQDFVFAIDAYFLLMWFLEALRFRIDALFNKHPGRDPEGPDVVRTRGQLASFQFLLSFVVGRTDSETDNLYQEVEKAGHETDSLFEWLRSNLEGAQSNENLEGMVKLGARSRDLYGLPFADVRRAALRALGWTV